MDDQSEEVRQKAVRALGSKNTNTNTIKSLLNCLEDNDDGVRRQVVEALGETRVLTQEVGLKLIGMLTDKKRQVQYSAAKSLKQLNVVSSQVAESLVVRFTAGTQEDVIVTLELLGVLGV